MDLLFTERFSKWILLLAGASSDCCTLPMTFLSSSAKSNQP